MLASEDGDILLSLLEQCVAPGVLGVVGVAGQLGVQLAAGPRGLVEEADCSLCEYLDCKRHHVLKHDTWSPGCEVRRGHLEDGVEAGGEVDPEHADVEAVRHPRHLLPDVAHHALGDQPQVGRAVQADLGAVGEDHLGLGLGAVQQDDADLALGDVRHVVAGGLRDEELLLDDEPVPLLGALLPDLLQEVLVAGDVTRDDAEPEPVVPGHNVQIRS